MSGLLIQAGGLTAFVLIEAGLQYKLGSDSIVLIQAGGNGKMWNAGNWQRVIV